MQLIILPIAIICNLVIGVVQRALAIHLVLSPLTYILAALSIVESAMSVTQTVELVAFVLAFLVSLGYEL
jgi:hypothetical protein